MRSESCVTSGTHCTITSSRISNRNWFAVQVTALDTLTGAVARSHPDCRDGWLEARLHPVVLTELQRVEGKPDCLRLHWEESGYFTPSKTEVTTKNILQMQIELHSAEQILIQNRTVSDFSFLVCDLVPSRTYSARVRCRLDLGQGHWSTWSNQLINSTAEDVPSTSPLVWSFMEAERVTLLWKAPSRPNGRIVNYSVACQDLHSSKLDHSKNKDADADADGRLSGCAAMGQRCLGSAWQQLQLSCPMSLPSANTLGGRPGECVCSVRASNSAGASPSGYVIVGSEGSRGPPLSSLHFTPLGDHQLGLRWSLGLGGGPEEVEGVQGFIVQWSSEYPTTPESLYWDWVNGSSRDYVIR
ncbi:uncharacterized protein LOC134442191, partial [Engraulis encrasicolus]|uniref:uncharacterized protein LOC134442191 n=1 Tax=Engraulis encrasicolus TaxID=184585 RepID=UPI002FD1F3B2